MKRAVFWVVMCLFLHAPADLEDTYRQLLTNSVNRITYTNPYCFMPLELLDVPPEQFGPIDISSAQSYNNAGVMTNLESNILTFLQTIGSNDNALLSRVTTAVYNTVISLITVLSKTTAYVTLQSLTPSSDYDTPSWFIEGNYSAPYYTGTNYKMVATITGRTTLLQNLAWYSDGWIWRNHTLEEGYLDGVLDNSLSLSAPNLIGTIYWIGDSTQAAVLSQPMSDVARLILTITPLD